MEEEEIFKKGEWYTTAIGCNAYITEILPNPEISYRKMIGYIILDNGIQRAMTWGEDGKCHSGTSNSPDDLKPPPPDKYIIIHYGNDRVRYYKWSHRLVAQVESHGSPVDGPKGM